MLKLLLKKQLFEIFRSYFYDAKKNKARSRLATALYIGLFVLLMAGILGGIFTLLAVKLCGPLAAAGLDWLYFALTGGIAVLLGVFGSIFNTYAGLYLPKDNDLLLSMPVPVSSLVAARLSGVYLMGLMYSAVVILPAVIIYWVTVGVTASAVLGGLVLTLLISLAVLVLSCALGWVAAKISQKLRNKSLVVVLTSLVFIGLYYFVYFKAQSVLQNLLANAGTYGAQIRSRAYPLYLFGSVGAGDWLAMGIVTLSQAALLALTLWVIARSFLKIATATGSVKKVRFEHRAVRAQSVQRALLGKELRRFAASPNYMLNCGLGIVMLPAAGIALLIKGRALAQLLDDAFGAGADIVPVLLSAALCLLASMNDMATPSVSLEGKSLWLAQSLPVKPWQVLRAKLKVQLALTALPALVPLVCMTFILPVTAALPLVFAEALAYITFSACLGLTLGVARANLTWTSELMPIKQSLAVTIALFGGWLYAIVFAGLYLWQGWKLGAAAYLAIAAAVTLAVTALLLRWLKTKGAQRFAML